MDDSRVRVSLAVTRLSAHVVCRDCLTKVQVRSTDCPVCRQSFADSKLASQHFVQSMVWQLRVRCVQHDKGCEWQGQLGTDWRNLKAHDSVCPFKPVTCSLRHVPHQLKDTAHHRKICSRRESIHCASKRSGMWLQ